MLQIMDSAAKDPGFQGDGQVVETGRLLGAARFADFLHETAKGVET
jgi:hypothetical protein